MLIYSLQKELMHSLVVNWEEVEVVVVVQEEDLEAAAEVVIVEATVVVMVVAKAQVDMGQCRQSFFFLLVCFLSLSLPLV